MTDDSDYKSETIDRIASARKKYPLQPIIFAGSGLSRRWLGAPSWPELLEHAIKACPVIDKPLNYYLQSEESNLPRVASRISESFHLWAWDGGRSSFPQILFESQVPKEIYLKYFISQHLKGFGSRVAPEYSDEAEAFSAIRPQSVITTNYDDLIEAIFKDYQPVLGRGLITSPFANIGEIYKIHGTVAKPSSIVITESDYQEFFKRRRYLTAKLLTFFAEHPILFVGYAIEDENIKGILSDLDEAMEIPGNLVENVFVLSRSSSVRPALERVVQVSPSKGVRVQALETDDFQWIFEAFGHNAPLENVNPKILRAILARSYHLVRQDIPKQKVEVDFDLISQKISSVDDFAKLFGIADLQSATEFSAKYPFNLTEVGKKLGFPGWHGADKLIREIEADNGVNIKSYDNRYHCTVRISKKSTAQMYSQDAVDLLSCVKDGKPYAVDLE